MSSQYITQNDILYKNLIEFYKDDAKLDVVLPIINGTSKLSIRIIDWFVTNYAKKNYVVYNLKSSQQRFKVYTDYKLKLKAYNKKRFDPFCRWERTQIPYKNNTTIETTIGQLNFFKWVVENEILDYIYKHYDTIEYDMNTRNSTAIRKSMKNTFSNNERKKREELSISASKHIKKEEIEIVVEFH